MKFSFNERLQMLRRFDAKLLTLEVRALTDVSSINDNGALEAVDGSTAPGSGGFSTL